MTNGPIVVAMPPMSQLNTPYAALPVLAGFLRDKGEQVVPVDLGLELMLAILEPHWLAQTLATIDEETVPDPWLPLVVDLDQWPRLAPGLTAFLQGRDLALAADLAKGRGLPRGPRVLEGLERVDRLFGRGGTSDRARYLATLALEDLADLIAQCVAPGFALTSYASAVAESQADFGPIEAAMYAEPDAVQQLLNHVLERCIPVNASVVAFSCPFPGNLLGALRSGLWLREHRPDAAIILGGGYPSTELRELSDPRIFAAVDAIVLDAGEQSLWHLIQYHRGADLPLLRTYVLGDDDSVVFADGEGVTEPPHGDLPPPSYEGLDLTRYLDLVDSVNPMHRLWNEGRWLKLTVAVGCYWSRCTFCDTSLPYIQDYRPARAATLADRMDALHEQTGLRGFHFTDEAAPPPVLVALAQELIRRGRDYRWWGNIRFEESFSADRCRLLAEAGCIGVTGGLEAAADGVLERIGKGVSVAQVARVTHGFKAAGIMVHAYLMYGFPGQTQQEHIDALETVRQLMAEGCIDSGFWHRFTATAHAPVGKDPEAFGVEITGPDFKGFARNNLLHHDPAAPDLDTLGDACHRAMNSWLGGEGLRDGIDTWLPGATTTLPPGYIRAALNEGASTPDPRQRALWLGPPPALDDQTLYLADSEGNYHHLELDDQAEPIVELLAKAQLRDWEPEDRGPMIGKLRESALLPKLMELGLLLI